MKKSREHEKLFPTHINDKWLFSWMHSWYCYIYNTGYAQFCTYMVNDGTCLLIYGVGVTSNKGQ